MERREEEEEEEEEGIEMRDMMAKSRQAGH